MGLPGWSGRARRAAPLLLLSLLLTAAAPAAAHAMTEGPSGASTGDSSAPAELAATPESQQFTGAATTRLAIEVPGGRNGMQPNLALVYSSQAGQGPYGAGWDLPIGRIERSRRLGVPRYDGSDTFLLILPDGAGELTPLPDGSYAMRIDEGRARLTANTSANQWTLNDRSGRVYTFGGVGSARIGPNPAAFATTFAWYLTEVRDPNGNDVDFTYEQTGGSYPCIDKIEYGGNASAAFGHVYRVRFEYADRPAAARRLSWGGGFAQELNRNLEAIVVERTSGLHIRTLDLVWAASLTNGLPLLSEVQIKGSDGTLLTLEAPPGGGPPAPAASHFEYLDRQTIPFRPARLENLQIAFFRDEPDGPDPEDESDPLVICSNRDFIDLNGDGRPDLVRTAGYSQSDPTWRVQLNQGPNAATLFDPNPLRWPAPGQCLSKRLVDSTTQGTIGTTLKAIVDMTGDGRADYVTVVETSPGQHQLRVFRNTGRGFATAYEVWATGLPSLRRGDSETGEVTRDLIDLDADGLPDAVHAQSATIWQVRWNTGASLAPAVSISAPLRHIRIGGNDSGDRTIRSDLFDLNGDGLPDKVAVAQDTGGYYWRVWYGTGSGFAANWERWDGVSQAFIREWNENEQRFNYDVFDVTGDGLPDFVNGTSWHQSTPEWIVRVNSGRGFLQARTWPAPNVIRKRYDDEFFHALQADTFDIDGDGFMDVVKLDGGGDTTAEVFLADPEAGPTDALVASTTNNFASATELTYAPSSHFNTAAVDPALADGDLHLPFPVWVVTEARTSDDTPAGTVTRRYRYDGGYFDPARREFWGFQWAWLTDDYGMTIETQFHQAEPLQGRERRRRTLARDPAQTSTPGVLEMTQLSWNAAESDGRWRVTLGSRAITHYGSASDLVWNENASRTVTSAFSYDDCGNIVREAVADSAVAGTTIADNRASFYDLNGGCTTHGTCAGICDHAEVTWRVNGLFKSYEYDARGNLTTATAWGGGDPTTTMEYDPDGNLVASTNPRGTRTTYAYDADRLRVSQKVDDAGGAALTTTYTYDARFGKETSRSGPGCGAVQSTYDVFGRLAAVIEPGQTATQPTRKYVYVLGARPRIETHTLELELVPHYRLDIAFFDALGRPQQRQSQRLVGNQVRTVVTDAVVRSQGGRIVETHTPYLAPVTTNPPTQFVPVPASHPTTVMLHDPFGRVVSTLTPDDRLETTSRAKIFRTVQCDAKHGASSNQGTCTEAEVDALDRVIAKRTFLGSATTPYSVQTFQYNAFDKVWLEQHNGDVATNIITSFDGLGRKLSVTDPDSGVWRYDYDLGGNLTYQDDPQPGQHVEITYDSLDRPLQKRVFTADTQGAGSPTTVAAYTYDAALCGRGKLASAADPSGTTTFAAYDARGNVVQATKQITFDGVTKAFTSTSSYDALGRLKTTAYPYPGDDGRESAFFDYTWHGSLRRIRSEHGAYLLGVTEDEFGRVTDAAYGNGVHDLSTYANHTNGFRLTRLVTQLGGAPPLRDLRYEDYDENGSVRAIRDVVNLSGTAESLTQVATYDDASRLVASVQCGAGRYASAFDHDNFGNLTAKDGLAYSYGGAGPHQVNAAGGADVNYDANGNMTGLPGGRALEYDREGRLVRVTRNGVEIARYLYDYSGRRVAARTPEGTTFFFGLFDWRAGEVVRYFRAGDRLIAVSRVSDNAVFARHAQPGPPVMLARVLGALPGLALLGIGVAVSGRTRRRVAMRLHRRGVVVLALAFYVAQIPFLSLAWAQCPDSTIGPPPPGTLFLHADHLGSPQLLTDRDGVLVERLVHRPYGQVGGVWDGTGASQGSSGAPFLFTGHRADDGTGLLYMGARYYDLGLGMFVSHDPAAQYVSPYTYVGWDPLNRTDPTGAIDPLTVGLILVALGAIASTIQAALNGASAGQALVVGLQSLVLGAAGLAVGGALGGVVGGLSGASAGSAQAAAGQVILAGYVVASTVNTVYSAVQAFQTGQYAVGSVAILGAAVAVTGAVGPAKHGLRGSDLSPTTGTANPQQVASAAGVVTDGVPASTNGGLGGFVRTVGRVGLDVLGKVWALPNTLIGVVVGAAGVPFGARVQLGNNAIQFVHYPLGEAGEALSLGNVQIFPAGSDPATTFDFFYGSPVPINLGLHEQAHTFQAQILGPFFLPAYAIAGGISGTNPFEQAANRYALGGSFWP
jgi:RHS repeat-associated protein